MESWSNFFVAVASAAATLAGLIFVAVSINLAKILSIKKLPARALQSLVLLIIILILCMLFLVPQSLGAEGVEILCIGSIAWIFILYLDISIYKQTGKEFKMRQFYNIILSQLSLLPYIIAGVMILRSGSNGMYWLVPGVIFSFFKSVSDAWVLLVEINR